MAAKFFNSLTEDTEDFQKQMGCMTGIFQLFDRHNMLTSSGRRVLGLTSGTSPGIRSSDARNSESQSRTQLNSAPSEKYPMKKMPEKQRIPVESPFSSHKCASVESKTFGGVIFPENPSRESQMVAQQTHDVWDFVKDSLHRELQGVKAKTSENYHGSKFEKKQSSRADAKQFLRALAKLGYGADRENEPTRIRKSSSNSPKDVSSLLISRDAPRRSYDGREESRGFLDSCDFSKGSIILKDLPRHSVDSGEVSSSSFKSLRGIDTCNGKVAQIQLQRSRSEARLPSVVAKLMGLEMLPDSDSIRTTDSMERIQVPSAYQRPTGASTRFPIEQAPRKHSDKPKTSQKQATRFFRSRTTGSPSAYSEIDKRLEDLELLQSGNTLRLRALKQMMGTTEMSNGQANFPSDKDLEQKTRKLEANNFDSSARNMVPPQNYRSPTVIMKPAKYVEKHDMHPVPRISLDSMSGMLRLSSNEPDYLRKNLERPRTSKAHGNDVNSDSQKGRRASKPKACIKSPSQRLSKDGNMGLGKTSSSLSPRMLPKKIVMEKRWLPPTLPDSRRPRKQPNKQNSEMKPAGRRQRTMPPNLKQRDNLESNFKSRNMSSCDSEASAQSYDSTSTSNSKHAEMIGSEISSISTADGPTTVSPERIFSVFADKVVTYHLHLHSVHTSLLNSTVQETTLASSEDSSESGFVPPEYPSPTSVLNSGMDNPDSSPVEHVVKSLTADTSMDDEKDLDLLHLKLSVDSDSKEAIAEFDFNKKKLQNIQNLVQKLRKLNSSCDEARTDCIASLCESSSPDHQYISKILLASGILLRTPTDFHFHPSGHAINPELFLVLEQTKGNSSLQDHDGARKTSKFTGEKNHRKVIFDTVNEILAKKLSITMNSLPWSRSVNSAAQGMMTSQMILQALCSEIESLQAKSSKRDSGNRDEDWKSIIASDISRQHHLSERWMDMDIELSGAVLDIERMIFRDLVSEVVIGEPSCLFKPLLCQHDFQ